MNIAEILKDCPKGTKLYSPLCGECYFDRLNQGTIICKKQNTQQITFTSEGYYMLPVFDDCECVLFPSKGNRDWSKFQRPFKDGDIVVSDSGDIHLLRTKDSSYCAYRGEWRTKLDATKTDNIHVIRLATEEEKQKLFDAIRDSGYKWNAETKTLEELVVPKFKVGNRIKLKNSPNNIITTVTKINEDGSLIVNNYQWVIEYELQDKYELVPNKFDISTLKPFDKVLTRTATGNVWGTDFFGYYKDGWFYCSGHIATHYCIPYNDETKHLLGTTNDCDECYKNW